MDVKITDQIIKSVDRASFYNLVDDSLYTVISQLNNVSVNQSQNTIWYTGKMGVRLAGVDTEKNVEVSMQNGYIDLGALSLQTGSPVTVYDGATTFIEAPYIDELVTLNGTNATTTHIAFAPTVGAEIAYIYKLNGSNIAGSTKYEQAATASATAFAYNPTTRVITLPTDVFEPNELLIAQYRYKAYGTSVSSTVESFSLNAKVVLDLTTEDVCTSQITHSQYIFPKAKVDGNFEVSMGVTNNCYFCAYVNKLNYAYAC